MANISLIGFMGVGKSTLGRYLARELNYRFVDMDTLIQRREERTIAEIFATDGEVRFRELEKGLIREMAGWRSTVIATGGGVVAAEGNLERLMQCSFVVCLWASEKTIRRRVEGSRHRPLLQTDDLEETIRSKLEERAGSYRRADLLVHTDFGPVRDVANRVLRQYRRERAAAVLE